MTTERRISLSSKYIPAIAPFIAKQDVRYYLNGFRVEPHPEQGVLIIATNGHVLAVVHDTDGFTNGSYVCTLPANIVSACRKKNATRLYFVGDVGYVTSADVPLDDVAIIGPFHIEVAHARAIDGTYPDWRRVISEPSGADQMCVQLEYLRYFETAAKLSHGNVCGRHGFIRAYNTKNQATVVHIEGLPEFLGLVMPAQTYNQPAIPDWLCMPSKKASEEPAEEPAKAA